MLVAKVHRSERRLVIVANRARRYTKAYTSLMRFLQSLRIPVAAVLRDSQAYVRSAECGMGIHEMKGALLQEDLDSWKPLLDWLERRTVETSLTGELQASIDTAARHRRDPRAQSFALRELRRRATVSFALPVCLGRFETLLAPAVNSDASSDTVNATMFGRPSASLALPTTTTMGVSLGPQHVRETRLDRTFVASTASKSPNIVRERLTTASSAGRVGPCWRWRWPSCRRCRSGSTVRASGVGGAG